MTIKFVHEGRQNDRVTLAALEIGAAFLCGGTYYIKSDETAESKGFTRCMNVSRTPGWLEHFSDDMEVTPVTLNVIVERTA